MKKICLMMFILLTIVLRFTSEAFAREEQRLVGKLTSGSWQERAKVARTLAKDLNVRVDIKTASLLSALTKEVDTPISSDFIRNGFVTQSEYVKRQYRSVIRHFKPFDDEP